MAERLPISDEAWEVLEEQLSVDTPTPSDVICGMYDSLALMAGNITDMIAREKALQSRCERYRMALTRIVTRWEGQGMKTNECMFEIAREALADRGTK